MKNYFILIAFVLLLSSCTKKNNFQREKQIFYLLKQYDIDFKSGKLIFFQNGNCGTCLDKSFELVNNILDSKEVLVIFKSYDENLISKINNDIKYLIDEKSLSINLGLNFPKDLFINIENGKIKQWGWLYGQNVDIIINQFND